MKGSTLHRSGLTKENMGVLASFVKAENKKSNTNNSQAAPYYKAAKSKELDILWGNVQRGVQKVHNVARSTTHKPPAAYFLIGFILGVLFMSIITLIVSISSMSPKTVETTPKTTVAVVGESAPPINEPEEAPATLEEKYIVKPGDTLNGISYRFYGKVDDAKISEIQRVNNIKSPTAIRAGQELIIPVSQDR